MLRFSYIGRVCCPYASALLQTAARSTIAAEAVEDEWTAARPFKDIPGPKALPLIGNSWRFMPYIGNYHNVHLQKLHEKLYDTYGEIVKLDRMSGKLDTVYLFNPSDIEKVLRNEGRWPIRDFTPSFTYYRNVTRRDLFQGVGSILATQGEEWQKFRSKVNPALMQPRSAKLYVEPIDGVADEFVNKIRRLKNRDEEMPANFHNELCKWALESISLVALDKRLGCLADNLAPDSEQQQMITAGIEIIEGFFKLDYGPSYWKYVSTPTWKKFVKSMDCFTNVAWKYVEEAMQRVKSRTCVADGDLSVLERILINEADPRIAFVTALDMMFGGIDTTSNTAAILLYHLTKNPEKQEKLYEETKKFLPSAKDSLTADKLESMKYLKACTKESMRMSPVAFGNGRTLNKDMVLSNYRVPKGTNVFMMHEFLSNREENFPQANKFVPERWLKGPNGEPAESKKTHPFVYMPFGFGPRMCLGRRFAEIEIETLIAKVIRNFRVEYNYGEMEYIVHLILKPASPLKFKMIERE